MNLGIKSPLLCQIELRGRLGSAQGAPQETDSTALTTRVPPGSSAPYARPMRAHVPQDVDLEDKLIYGLTPVRFGYLVIAAFSR